MTDSTSESITDLFYLVGSLLSSQEQLSTLPHDMSVAAAIEYMGELGLSQLPVTSWTTVIGVFSYRSFCRFILEMENEFDQNEIIGEMSVGEFIEQHRFYNNDDNWESILGRIKSDNSVLVGNRDSFSGSITPMDVVRFLYKVAKPFVVIAEIELSIRSMITNCVNNEELHTCIQNSLAQLYPSDKLPAKLTEMTFNDYFQVICNGHNWVHFEPFFGGSGGSMRKRTRNYLKKIGELRNDVFHFKRTLEEGEIQFLNNKRDLLQNKARIFEGEQRQAAAINETQIQAPAEVRSF